MSEDAPLDYIAAFDDVFDRLGGADGLYEWAAQSPENLREFYKLIAKRLPNEVTGEGGGPLLIQLKQI
jgi:hypothetical protein